MGMKRNISLLPSIMGSIGRMGNNMEKLGFDEIKFLPRYHQNLGIFWGVWLFQKKNCHKKCPPTAKSMLKNKMENLLKTLMFCLITLKLWFYFSTFTQSSYLPGAKFSKIYFIKKNVYGKYLSYATHRDYVTFCWLRYSSYLKTSMLRRLQAQTLLDATPPILIGKIHHISKMAVTFEPLMIKFFSYLNILSLGFFLIGYKRYTMSLIYTFNEFDRKTC